MKKTTFDSQEEKSLGVINKKHRLAVLLLKWSFVMTIMVLSGDLSLDHHVTADWDENSHLCDQ